MPPPLPFGLPVRLRFGGRGLAGGYVLRYRPYRLPVTPRHTVFALRFYLPIPLPTLVTPQQLPPQAVKRT